MRRTLLPTLALALALPAAAQAQSPRFGVALNILVPTGEFSQTTYGTSPSGIAPAKEGYDTGLGAQFWITFPASRSVAFRLNFSGSSNDGTYDDPGVVHYNARQTMFSIGTELQIFLQEGAFSHKGSYLFGGVAADFERFDLGYGDLNNYYYSSDIVDTSRKTRLGGNFGFGHSFGYGSGIKFNLEVGYHATLQERRAGDPPKSNAVKIGFGMVF